MCFPQTHVTQLLTVDCQVATPGQLTVVKVAPRPHSVCRPPQQQVGSVVGSTADGEPCTTSGNTGTALTGRLGGSSFRKPANWQAVAAVPHIIWAHAVMPFSNCLLPS